MKENEAIKELKENIEMPFGSDVSHEASKLAIKALEEIQQYREIGTVDECREARERQERKKPNGRYKTRYIWDSAYCPVCGCGITARWNFCQSCGQAIDWSE